MSYFCGRFSTLCFAWFWGAAIQPSVLLGFGVLQQKRRHLSGTVFRTYNIKSAYSMSPSSLSCFSNAFLASSLVLNAPSA